MSNTRLIVPYFQRAKWDQDNETIRQGRLSAARTLFEVRQLKVYDATRNQLKEMGLVNGGVKDGGA